MLALLFGPLIQLLLSSLAGFGVNVPTSISQLVAALEPVAGSLIADIKAGGSPSTTTIAILQTLVPLIQAIKADTSIDPKYVEYAKLLDDILANVLAADQLSQKAVDPTLLHLEEPIV